MLTRTYSFSSILIGKQLTREREKGSCFRNRWAYVSTALQKRYLERSYESLLLSLCCRLVSRIGMFRYAKKKVKTAWGGFRGIGGKIVVVTIWDKLY